MLLPVMLFPDTVLDREMPVADKIVIYTCLKAHSIVCACAACCDVVVCDVVS